MTSGAIKHSHDLINDLLIQNRIEQNRMHISRLEACAPCLYFYCMCKRTIASRRGEPTSDAFNGSVVFLGCRHTVR